MATRRVFLHSSGAALLGFGTSPRALALTALDGGAPARRRTLVFVFQRGACDGLNTLVPYAEPAYRKLRPSIAIPAPRAGDAETALDLDGRFGLHPALGSLLPLWKEGSLAAVHALGSPDPTRSHFDAQDFMESGTPGRKSTDDGWMNRHMQAQAAAASSPLRAVSLTPNLPRILQGKAPAAAMASTRGFEVRRGADAAQGFEAMYAGAVDQALGEAGREAFEAIELLKKADPARIATADGVSYPRGRYGDGLRQIAQLVKADLGLELAFTESGGWDHHAAEGGATGQLANRLRELGDGLAAFRRDLGGRYEDVVVVTLTEFGRTARENGSRGTDHGHGSVALVMGGSVRGARVCGRWPGLREDQLFEGRDLAVTTDFRSLLAELLVRHMGARDLRAVFPGFDADPRSFPGVMRA